MKRRLSLAAMAIVTGFGAASSAAPPAHNVILLDASASNPMVVDAEHARRVAGDVVKQIGALAMRDFVTVSTLGEYDVTKHPMREGEITTKFPPNVAMSWIAQVIASFPEDVKHLPGGIQKSTHILGSLELMARRVSCGDRRVRFFVLTDGQENGQALDDTPTPIFQGCAEMTMIGIIGKTPAETKDLAAAWMKWCAGAGFTRCNYLN